jgi:hypothetical protein
MPRKNKKPKTDRREGDTIKRARFFSLWDNRDTDVSIRDITHRPDLNISTRTGWNWLDQRNKIGSPLALRRQRKFHQKKLGPHNRVPEEKLRELLNRNEPDHYADYATIIEHRDLPIKPKTLQQNLATRLGAYRLRRPKSSDISDKNKKEREDYSRQNNGSVNERWAYVYFTDEVHFNSVDLGYQRAFEIRISGD